MGIISFVTVRFVEVIVVLALILFMPSIPPKANFTSFKITPVQDLKGKLAVNNRLDGAEHIFENELKGAEAFAEYNGELYSSLFTGEVVKLSKGHIVPIVKFGKPCTGHSEEAICGRPLGLQFNKNGDLFVCDAYYGIWKVDVKSGAKTQIVSMDEEIEGKKPMIPNSITLSENGDFYWTDSSAEFMLQDGIYSLLADGTGRLIHYNAKTKTNKVLMDGLFFANGVMLSSDEEFLIVSETGKSRVYRFHLKGPKAGTHDIFADGLPGLPDNINSDGQDGFFIPLIIARDSDHPIFAQVIAPFPWIRKIAARILGIIEIGFKTAHNIYPNMYTQMAIHTIGHFESVSLLLPQHRTTVLHYDKNGELIESLHATDRSIGSISDVFIYGDQLYLGSPFNNYIGKISLAKVGLEHLRQKRETKPITEAPMTPPPAKTPEKVERTTPKPTEAPVKKPTPKPVVKETQKQVPPVKQTPPTPAPTQAPKTTPKPAPAKETPKPAPVKETPKPVVKENPPKAVPLKESPPKAVPVKESPPKKAPVKETPPTRKPNNQNADKEMPKVVPVRENSVPKPRI